MKSRRGSDDSCFCSSCLYKHNKAYRGIERTGSKIDKLYRDKYLPLRESKLIDKLERTRAVYDDIRAPVLADSESKRNITNKKRRDSTELDKCCSCCRCTRKANNIIGDTGASSDYGYVTQSSKRRVRFKPEFIKSEPCVCLAKFGSLLKKHSEFLQSKLKREWSVPVLRNKIKEASSKQRSRVGKVLKNIEKNSGSEAHFEEMLKLSVKKMPKSRDKVEDMKQKNNYKGPKYQKELDPTLCPCPQEKLVLKIRKDSIRKFYEDLEKKRTLKHLECKSECIQDICIPKECLDKIKLSKGKKSQNKHKKSEKQRKSLKQIVSKAGRRKKKRSVMCQCDDTSILTKEGNKQQSYLRQNKVKFVPSKKGMRDKSHLRSNQATLDKPQSKTDDGNTLKRCFCTLKFKPPGTQNVPQKYSSRPELDYYPHLGQSGDMKISSMQMHKTMKKAVKNKSNGIDVYDCDPNECLKDYKIRKKHTINAKKDRKLPAPTYILNATNQTNPGLPESDQDNRRVLRIGSSISFNIEFFKENVPKDTHKSIKTNTVPHYLANKSIKSIRQKKSNKKITKHKRKVIIMDNLSKNDDLNLDKNMSSKIITKIKKYAKSKNKIKTATKDIEFKETINDIDLKTEMVDQSTKITHKDMRLLKPFECEPQTCVPDNCDPHLCLKKRSKHKHVITTTDFPKMISVASGVHKRKLKHVQARSKSHFRRKNSFAKSDLNTYEDNEQIYSNVLPKTSKKNTLRLSSNFSFAIEIGRGVVPHMNPIENIKRYSSIHKAKKIKSSINNDNDNYTQRKNKSKKSVINKMVKRCMCTLNLSKQQNGNKSLIQVNEKFAPNVYTVNTVTTSNNGPFSQKLLSKKRSPCDVRKVTSNEYKCDINNYYAAWHSQVICNFIHRKKIMSTKLYTRNKLKRQLKKKLCFVSKSLSCFSDKELKKNVEWTPWHYAESKNVTLYQSSDYINILNHVGKHQTFTKSSKYWEKSYCTMNLKTIYNKNGKTKKLMEHDSQKNCVRVGSNINLNVEFYKNNICLEQKNDMLSTIITRKDDSLRNKMTQDLTSTSNKAAYSIPENQRCFCTLKLQKKSHTKHINKSKQKPSSKVNLKSIISYVSKSQNTPKVKRLKNIPNEISTAEKIMNTTRLVPEESFFPRKCIPGMCVPGQCDPATCHDMLYKRKLKTRSISAATKTTKKIRAGVFTQQSSVKNAKTQSHNKEGHEKHNERTYKQTSVPYSNIGSGKQCAKFGSNISFNIEFYKENSPTSKRIHYEPEVCDRKYSKSSKYADASVTTKKQDSGQTKLTARPRDSLIKRCFCTLKLQKKQKKSLLTEVHSVGVMAGVKNKWYSDKVLSNHVNMNKGDIASIYNTKSILRKHKQSLTGEKENKSKYEKPHIAMTTLLPYECESGTCVPGACNPYECLQRIKARKLIKRNIGSVTTRHNKKSLGTMSKYGTRSKHRRIQTVSFQQNDLAVSRAIPKKMKQKSNSSVSNNQCVRIGSNINLSIEFFKDKNCNGRLPHKTICEDDNVIKTTSHNYKPVINTKALIPHVTKKHKETKHTLNKSQEPIVNFQMNVKKQTLSQLSQTRQKYFSKNKGLLRYECEPNVCIPGQCDPYECYELIQNRTYKDCSAVTVANVRDFATNATPCYTCKSKRIQTGHHHREGAGIKFMKSVLDHKSRNYIRISSNFGFHIEICKKGEDGPLREVNVHDDGYKYKKGHTRLHDQASQSQYIKSRSQSTYAKNKLQRCFCTKKFFNSFAKTTNRNLEYTTNYCALVPNILPTVHNVTSSHDSQHFVYHMPFHMENQKKCEEPNFPFKCNIKPKRLLKFRHNTSKVLDENRKTKIKSYLSFDLELHKRKKFKKDLNKTKKKTYSDQHIIIPKQKSNKKKLKTIDSKSIQGQGDSKKTVGLKRCYSTINFTRKYYEKKCKTEQGLVNSRYETIQQALKAKGYSIKYILTDSSEPNTFHLPQVKLIKRDEVCESLLNSNNMRFLCNTYPCDRVLSIKDKLIEIKKYKNLNHQVGNKEKCSYFQNVYNKLHPYADKIKFKQLFKNIMKSRRRSDKIVETTR